MFRFVRLITLVVLVASWGTHATPLRAHSAPERYRFLVTASADPAWERVWGWVWEWEDGASTVRSILPERDVSAMSAVDDRRLLVAIDGPGPSSNFFLLNDAGEMSAQLTDFIETPADFQQVRLSPDGHYALLSTWRHGVYRVDLRAVPAREMEVLLADGFNAAASFDGRYVVYEQAVYAPPVAPHVTSGPRYGSAIWIGDMVTWRLWTLSNDVQGRCSSPDWHPSAHRIVYECVSGGHAPINHGHTVYIADLETGETLSVPASGRYPRWSPSGQRIASLGAKSVYVLTLETMREEEIPLPPEVLQSFGVFAERRIDWLSE